MCFLYVVCKQAVRVGDVFALLVEFYHSQGNMQQAYVLIEKMQERKIIINPYLDTELVTTLSPALPCPRSGGPGADWQLSDLSALCFIVQVDQVYQTMGEEYGGQGGGGGGHDDGIGEEMDEEIEEDM